MKRITNTYFKFKPGEFLPIYIDGKFANRREFHLYRIKSLLTGVSRAF